MLKHEVIPGQMRSINANGAPLFGYPLIRSAYRDMVHVVEDEFYVIGIFKEPVDGLGGLSNKTMIMWCGRLLTTFTHFVVERSHVLIETMPTNEPIDPDKQDNGKSGKSGQTTPVAPRASAVRTKKVHTAVKSRRHHGIL